MKKLSLAVATIAFCLSLGVASSYAQPGKARWTGNNGKHKGWTQGQRRGWNRGRKTGWRDDDFRRVGVTVTEAIAFLTISFGIVTIETAFTETGV